MSNKILPVTTVGSYAWPGWFYLVMAAAERGELGPQDLQETLTDAVEIALQDQRAAGVDILTDGEMRRVDFIVSFPKRLRGIRQVPQARRLGPDGHDQRPRFAIEGDITAPEGLGTVEEFRFLREHVQGALKVAVPGPHTMAGRLAPDGRIYKAREDIAWALVPIVRRELEELVKAGADLIQVDEPSIACYKQNLPSFVKIFNETVRGIEAKLAVHLCFGNYRARPIGLRTYTPLFPGLLEVRAQQFVLEFANREMAEADLWQRFPNDRELAAGVVDVKNHFVEPVEVLAERIRVMLKYVRPEKLWLVPDCGFSQTPRFLAFQKLCNLVKAAEAVRAELAGSGHQSVRR
jgi:5-methyltetrahydropteroyltriglutamate--homocysteine methyltransferase